MSSKKISYVGLTTKWTHFGYEPSPLCGVGKDHLPMINMDKYIDTSKNLELHIEACKGLAMISNYKSGIFVGSAHETESDKGRISFTEILHNLNQYDPTGIHRAAINEIEKTAENPRESVYKYVYYAMGGAIPWFFAYYLRINDFHKKTKEPITDWTDDARKYFPKIIQYVESLPLKIVGRVLFFTTYPGAGVVTHRDYYIDTHCDQNINLFFEAGWRPSFVWDDVAKKKLYLEQGSTSYFFNNRDYHGVDPEPTFRYTLRVDGIFEDWLQDELGLENGTVWSSHE